MEIPGAAPTRCVRIMTMESTIKAISVTRNTVHMSTVSGTMRTSIAICGTAIGTAEKTTARQWSQHKTQNQNDFSMRLVCVVGACPSKHNLESGKSTKRWKEMNSRMGTFFVSFFSSNKYAKCNIFHVRLHWINGNEFSSLRRSFKYKNLNQERWKENPHDPKCMSKNTFNFMWIAHESDGNFHPVRRRGLYAKKNPWRAIYTLGCERARFRM